MLITTTETFTANPGLFIFGGGSEGRYLVKLAESPAEVESALRLRYEVFNVELGSAHASDDTSRLEFDDFDLRCRHLIVVDKMSAKTVGTYRLNSIESAGGIAGFYSYREFEIEKLPPVILRDGIEIGRACIAPAYRNTKVLFLLWKGLAAYLKLRDKRFFFGCCSLFTRNESAGVAAYRQLIDTGHLECRYSVAPRKNGVDTSADSSGPVELPALFNMYLRIGARVCGPPMIDHDFGTIDFFVVCDSERISEKYRRMFFSAE